MWLYALLITTSLTVAACAGDGASDAGEGLSEASSDAFAVRRAPNLVNTESADRNSEPALSAEDAAPLLDGALSLSEDSETGPREGTEEPAGPCYPECFAKQCGDDSCGGSCGTCPAGMSCVDDLCTGEPTCTPTCSDKQCGDDGCGGSCGTCQAEEACVDHACTLIDTCAPDCSAKDCGDDGCGGTCGTCSAPEICASNQCICEGDCSAKTCGDDGCGGSCGVCDAPLSCVDYSCVCVPDCAGKTCGDDGCGGSCGVCGCSDQSLFIRAANFAEPTSLQVFFTTTASPNWVEGKSKWATFDTAGSYETIQVHIGAHAAWTGTITGIRIDPMNSNEAFGIDDVCLGVSAEECLLHWTFDGASEVTSPFFDWTLHGIGETWTDGERWGGEGIQGDPFFRTLLDFECEP